MSNFTFSPTDIPGVQIVDVKCFGDALWRMLEKRLVEKNAHQGEFFVSSQR